MPSNILINIRAKILPLTPTWWDDHIRDQVGIRDNLVVKIMSLGAKDKDKDMSTEDE